jgi:predicted transcriptional regulator
MAVFPWQSKNKISPRATFMLTEIGKDEVIEYTGDMKSRILQSLEHKGASTVDSIARTSRLSRSKVEDMIPKLIDAGYIQASRRGVD